MKKSFLTAIVAIFAIGTTSVYGQFVNPVVGGNVLLTDPTNNVIIGPLPATPTNLHVNSTTQNSTVTIENTGTNIAQSSYLIFKNAGATYSIGTSSFPAAGSGLFHIGNLIHMSTGGITFSTGYSPEYTGPFAISKYCFRGGLSSFDSIYTRKIGINMYAPYGYNFGVYGNSYFQNKVVIGTTSTTLPTTAYKLYVGGSIICEELVVKLQANWGDYVFAPDYTLMKLSDVKTYIAANSHLPGVPAACEVAENGVATGEMLTIQMKKIEELTLYLIQMEERIKQLEAQNKALLSK